MMFWMAYGAGLVRQRSRCMRGCNKHSNRIWRQSGRCFLINLDLLAVRRSPRVALPWKTTSIFGLFVVPGFLEGCFSRLLGAFGAIVAEALKRWQQWNDMPKKRFLALLKSIEFWAITVFLILLSGNVGVFEGMKTHPIDWSLCFFVGVGAIWAFC